jgi:hypothetical protein
MKENDVPLAAAAPERPEERKCPRNTITDMYRPWKSQYQKNFSAVPSLSKPTMKKNGITKMTEDRMR